MAQKGKSFSVTDFLKIPSGKNFLLLNLGLVLTAIGIVFFKAPNKFIMGGTSGLSILLADLIPSLNVGTVMFIVNMALVGVGFIFLGKGIGASTVYASIALSAYTWLLEKIYPMQPGVTITNDTMLELIWSVLLPAIGSAIIFNVGASTGGTDIIALILQKKTSIEVGRALLLSDCIIVIIAWPVFGPQIFLYCALGTVMKSALVDNFIDSLNMRKSVTIVSCHPKEVREFIVKVLHRGATIYKAEGAFSGEEQEAISTILNRRQAMILRNYIRKIDPKAFITIVNTSETIGKGFRQI